MIISSFQNIVHSYWAIYFAEYLSFEADQLSFMFVHAPGLWTICNDRFMSVLYRLHLSFRLIVFDLMSFVGPRKVLFQSWILRLISEEISLFLFTYFSSQIHTIIHFFNILVAQNIVSVRLVPIRYQVFRFLLIKFESNILCSFFKC